MKFLHFSIKIILEKNSQTQKKLVQIINQLMISLWKINLSKNQLIPS
jgi:hypothetical protein